MQAVQTEAAPPNHGRIALATIGSTANRRPAPRKTVAADKIRSGSAWLEMRPLAVAGVVEARAGLAGGAAMVDCMSNRGNRQNRRVSLAIGRYRSPLRARIFTTTGVPRKPNRLRS